MNKTLTNPENRKQKAEMSHGIHSRESLAVAPERGGGERGFWSLFLTQFQGAFSDNTYRTLAMFLIIGMTLPRYNAAARELRMAVVGALFALPFLLFSMAGGYLADRFSKRSVAIGIKVAEIGIMGLALMAMSWH